MTEYDCHNCNNNYDEKNELTFEEMDAIEREIIAFGRRQKENREVLFNFTYKKNEDIFEKNVELSVVGNKKSGKCIGYKIGEKDVSLIYVGFKEDGFWNIFYNPKSKAEELIDYLNCNSFMLNELPNKQEISEILLAGFEKYKQK